MLAFRSAFSGLLLALLPVLLGLPGCSERSETASILPDSTTVYAAKDPDELEASITFYRSVSKKTGSLLGEDGPFPIEEKSMVRARVNLRNIESLGGRPGMFHLAWVDPEGKEFFTKRIDFDPRENEECIESAVSAYPGKRDPGRYKLRVYFFRERIAEKYFLLETKEETAAREKAEKETKSKSSSKTPPKKSDKKPGSSKKSKSKSSG